MARSLRLSDNQFHITVIDQLHQLVTADSRREGRPKKTWWSTFYENQQTRQVRLQRSGGDSSQTCKLAQLAANCSTRDRRN